MGMTPQLSPATEDARPRPAPAVSTPPLSRTDYLIAWILAHSSEINRNEKISLGFDCGGKSLSVKFAIHEHETMNMTMAT